MNLHVPVLLDLNTQRDLLLPDGVYPLVNADKLLEPLKRIFAWAQRARIPVVSTRLRYLIAPIPGATLSANGPAAAPPRQKQRLVCHPQTPGYQKITITQLRKRQELPMDCGTSLPVDGFKTTQQFVFDLPSLNPFECPRLDRLMSESEVPLWLIIGGPLEWTIRTAVLGLLQRRQKVAVVSDAIGQWDPYEGDMALRQIESKNIEWLNSAQVSERFGKPQPVRPSLLAQIRPASLPPSPPRSSTPAPSAPPPARKRSTTEASRPVAKRPAPRQKMPSRQYRMS